MTASQQSGEGPGAISSPVGQGEAGVSDFIPESLLLRELGRRGPGLRFSPALEGKFLDFHRRFFLRQTQYACGGALLLLIGMHVAALWVDPVPDRLANLQALLLFGVLSPALIVGFAVLLSGRGAERLYLATAGCSLVTAVVALVLPALYAQHDAVYHYRFTEFLLVFVFLLAGLPFRIAIALGSLILLAEALRAAIFGLPPSQSPTQQLVLSAFWLAGAAACYLQERAVRRSFLTENLYFGRSIQDSLTRVLNRRGWDQAAGKAWAQARRDGTEIGLAVLDIDHFKAYNDGLGHPAGDEALREVARCLRTQLARRPFDLVARLGGEEFVVLWYATRPELVDQLAERGRKAIEQLGIAHPNGGPLTVSVGYTHLVPDAAVSVDDAYALADSALYAAKLAGRNTVRKSSAQLLSAANAVKLGQVPNESGAT